MNSSQKIGTWIIEQSTQENIALLTEQVFEL